jgi:TolB-like protein
MHALVGSLLLGGFVSAGVSRGDAPATRPVAANPSQPAPAVNDKDAATKVLVLPLSATDPADQREWLGKVFEQSILTELSRGKGVQPITLNRANSATAYDASSALAAAREAGAQIVLFGTYQTLGREVRVLGQILDVPSGRPVGGLRVTGPLDELFEIEDALANQVRRQLPVNTPPEPSPTTAANARQSTSLEPLRVAPPTRSIAPAPDTTLPDQTALLNGPPSDDFGSGYSPYDNSYDNYAYEGYGPVYGYGPYAGSFYGGFFPFIYGTGFNHGRHDHARDRSRDQGSALQHLSDGTTQFQGNYNRFPGNYITPLTGNYITPRTGNFNAPPAPPHSVPRRQPLGQTIPPFPNGQHLPLPRIGPPPPANRAGR